MSAKRTFLQGVSAAALIAGGVSAASAQMPQVVAPKSATPVPGNEPSPGGSFPSRPEASACEPSAPESAVSLIGPHALQRSRQHLHAVSGIRRQSAE